MVNILGEMDGKKLKICLPAMDIRHQNNHHVNQHKDNHDLHLTLLINKDNHVVLIGNDIPILILIHIIRVVVIQIQIQIHHDGILINLVPISVLHHIIRVIPINLLE